VYNPKKNEGHDSVFETLLVWSHLKFNTIHPILVELDCATIFTPAKVGINLKY
jgi:hypothetical protein